MVPDGPLEETTVVVKPESLLAHADFVRALARRLLLDGHAAEDAVQNTWVAALERPPRAAGSLRSWLAAVTRNFARLAVRGARRRAERERAAARPEGAPSTEEIVAWEGVRRRVVEAVLALDRPYRDVILCRFYEELPPRDIAARLGIPVETVKTRLKRGLRKLRSRLEAELGDGGERSWCLALLPVAAWKVGMGSAGAAGAAGGGVAVAGGVSAAGAGAASMPFSLPGVIAMGLKMKIGIAAAVLLAGVAAVWVLVGPGAGESVTQSGDDTSLTGALGDEGESTKSDKTQDTESAGAAALQTQESQRAIQRVASSTVMVRGRVVDEDGHGLDGVAIEETEMEKYNDNYSYYKADLLKDAVWNDMDRKTKQDGGFLIPLPLHRLPVTFLRFRHTDYQTRVHPMIKVMAGFDRIYTVGEIRLTPAYFVKGRVVDGKNQPVAGCSVTTPGHPWSRYKWKIQDHVITDDEGRFTLSPRKKETMRVTAFQENQGIGWSYPVLPGRGKEIPSIQIKLRRCAPITGRLLNADGSPAACKRLFAAGKVEGYEMKVPVDAGDDGRFTFPPLPMAVYRIEVEQVGVPGNVGNYDELEWFMLADSVEAGTGGLVLHLPPASKLVLLLEDEDGQPVDIEPVVKFQQYVAETLDALERNYITSCGFQWTGKVSNPAPGAFVYDNIQHGTFYLDIQVEGYARISFMKAEVPPPPGSAELEVVLRPVRSISGRVHHADGRPAQGVAVQDERYASFHDEHEHTYISFNDVGIRTHTGTIPGSAMVTDERGFFRFDGVTKGHHMLFFSVGGVAVLREPSVKITEEDANVEVSVTLPPLDGSIEGTIRNAKGIPLCNACVVAWNGGELINMTRADEEGRYGFRNLPDGPYVVDARCLSEASLRWEGSQSNKRTRDRLEDLDKLNLFNAHIRNGSCCRLDLTIDPWNGVVKGQVITRSGKLPEGLFISLAEYHEGGEEKERLKPSVADLFHFETDRNNDDRRVGHFRFSDLRAGRYRVTVEWDWHGDAYKERRVHSEPIILEPSSVHALDIYLALTSIQGTIVDKITREPIANARPMLFSKKDGREFDLNSHPDGTFDGYEIPAGDYMLVIQHESHRPFIMEECRLLENQDLVGLLCEMEPGCSVQGFVKLKEGTWRMYGWRVIPEIPPIGAYWYAGGRVLEDGCFTLKGLPAGPIKLILFNGSEPVDEKTYTLPLPASEQVFFEAPGDREDQ